MTSLNPTHFPSKSGNPAHGQAMHQLSPEDKERYEQEARKYGRRSDRYERPKKVTPVIPDLRFEQSYLVSIRPFLKPKAGSSSQKEDSSSTVDSHPRASHLSATAGGNDSKSLVTSAQEDEIFSCGRQVVVDWRMASWVTIRDQLFSPLAQGILWGFLTIGLSSISSGLHGALYPPAYIPRGRVTGGPSGKLGGGEIVGSSSQTGYWRGFVRSIFGGLETAAA